MKPQRDLTIDTLRGFAIFTMIAANLAGRVLAEPHPLAFRFYGSFAAPLFILLAGMMVGFSSLKKSYTFPYFFKRGISVIGMAALLDILVYRTYPFITWDVLYLIGFSLIAAYLFNPLKIWLKFLIVLMIFALTPFLQHYLGYLIPIPDLHSWNEVKLTGAWQIIKRWLIDGWFPIFPWLGFSFLGVIFASLRWAKPEKPTFRLTLLPGIIIFLAGGIYLLMQVGGLVIREGYSELFYPPTIAYSLTAIGVIIILFALVDLKPSLLIYRPLQAMGEAALFIYILHLALIEFALYPFYQNSNFLTFLLFYLILLVICIITAYALRIVRKKWLKPPFLIRMLIGG